MIKFACEAVNFADFTARAKTYSKEFLLQIYFEMLRIRLIEEAIERDYHKDQMKSPVHLAIGMEGSSVGCNIGLTKTDLIYCSHRTHAHYLAKGGDLNAMMAELHCRETGCAKSLAGSMHLLDKRVGMEGSSAIVGGAIPIATGFALSQKLSQAKAVSVVYFGDAATEEGVHWESLNFAVLKKLPVIFVCENNFYSVCTPLEERQPMHSKIVDRAHSFGVPTLEVNGNDVLAVFEAMKTALNATRDGNGPYYLVVNTYRYRGHHGAGDDSKSGYRNVVELQHWQEQDPLTLFCSALTQIGVLSETVDQDYKNKINAEIEASFEFALNSPYPSKELLFNVVYAN